MALPDREPRVVRQLYRLLLPYRRTVTVGLLCLVLAGQQLTLDLRVRLYRKLQRQSAAYFADRRTGDLLARLTADVEGVQDVVIRGTDSVVANGLRIVLVAAIFITLQPLLGVLVLTPMLAVGVLLLRYNRRVKPVYQAARAANAHEFIVRLADGYGTAVGERGARLSGGQKQRLAIARAIVAAPRILLLDEPTSAVDPESEAMIVDALAGLPDTLTTLIATHRLSLARAADRVVVLVDGRVVEDGAPAELLA